MSTQLRRGEPIPLGVRRIFRRQTLGAIEALQAKWPPTDESVHEARKRMRKARAALRLARKSLGEREFRAANAALRDAARPLSEIRDSIALLEALDGLAPRLPPSDRRAAALERTRLVASRRRIRQRIFRARGDFAPVIGALRSALRRVDDRLEGVRGWSPIALGLARVHGAARDAWAEARRDPTVEALHEWRKQAKYLAYELRLVQPLRPRRLRKLVKQLQELTDRLGDDHDLVVLRERIQRSRARSARPSRATTGSGIVRAIDDAIDSRRRTLQALAWRLGARIHRERSKRFVEWIERGWRKRKHEWKRKKDRKR